MLKIFKLLSILNDEKKISLYKFSNIRFLNDIFNLCNLNYYFLNIIINIIVFNNNYFLFSKNFIHL